MSRLPVSTPRKATLQLTCETAHLDTPTCIATAFFLFIAIIALRHHDVVEGLKERKREWEEGRMEREREGQEVGGEREENLTRIYRESTQINPYLL